MKKKKTQVSRVWLLFLGILGFALILILKLYFVQIVDGDTYRARADKQYYVSKPGIFDRGNIYFTNKDGSLFPAAVQKSSFSISINPSAISNPDFIFEKLSEIITLDKTDFDSKVLEGDSYASIISGLDIEVAEKIRKLNLLGVDILQEKNRFYPGGRLAAQTLGLVAYKGDELAGRYGLERYYENVLKRNNEAKFINFFAEVFTNIKKGVSSDNDSEKEGNVVTFLEPQAQSFLEIKLEELNEKWDSNYSGGIVIDPKTGEIIAMASYPTFNPNNFQDVTDPSLFSNPLVENIYEMGSIIKAITMAIGLDSGAVTPETTYFDPGVIYLDNYKISNYDGVSRGTVNMQEVLNQSLNTGAAFVANEVGHKNFARRMLAFGLDEESGIDLPSEASNLVDNLQSNRDVEFATASFGQGIALTPTATVRALSVLANGGVLINPHIIEKINFDNGFSRKIAYDGFEKRVISEEAAEDVTRMLVKVVDDALLGGGEKMSNYSIAAKTGTAQIASQGGYYDDKFFHTFFGYFPAFDAKFLVFLFTYDPKGVKYASQTLTTPFMEVTKYLINYYEIPPDR